MADIFLIDDDALVNYLNKELIQEMAPKSQIEIFESANLALQYLQIAATSTNPLLPKHIFLDINMPVMDGWEFLDHFAQQPALMNSNIKIYLLSSSIDHLDIERSVNHPLIVTYLEKPLTIEQMEMKGVLTD